MSVMIILGLLITLGLIIALPFLGLPALVRPVAIVGMIILTILALMSGDINTMVLMAIVDLIGILWLRGATLLTWIGLIVAAIILWIIIGTGTSLWPKFVQNVTQGAQKIGINLSAIWPGMALTPERQPWHKLRFTVVDANNCEVPAAIYIIPPKDGPVKSPIPGEMPAPFTPGTVLEVDVYPGTPYLVKAVTTLPNGAQLESPDNNYITWSPRGHGDTTDRNHTYLVVKGGH